MNLALNNKQTESTVKLHPALVPFETIFLVLVGLLGLLVVSIIMLFR